MLHHRSMPYRRLALLALAAVMLVALISACGKKEAKATVIATYNGGEVTDKEFDKYIAFQGSILGNQMAMYASIPQFKEQIIKQYIINKELIKSVSDEDKKQAKTAADSFKKTLEQARKTNPDLKKQMDADSLSVKDAVAMYQETAELQSAYKAKEDELKKQVTDDEIKTEFDKTPSDYNVVTVRHILIGTNDPNSGAELMSDEDALKKAEEVKAKLEAGGDWAALAKEYSTDTGSKDNGGLYENQVAKKWVGEFKDAANKQPIGEIGDPVQTQFGYHVIKVEKREEASSADKLSQQAKDVIIEEVAGNKFSDYMKEQEDKLGIKITLPPEPSPSPSESGAPSESPSESPSASPSASAK
ncbi:peptidylprolyl isomerase [Cohnella terricola]|nr:peptidylprolyl isomerase [Cohnella terricola]